MSSPFYKPRIHDNENTFEKDLLTRYYDPDAISEQDIAELQNQYPDQKDQIKPLAEALADDFIDESEKSRLTDLGVSDVFWSTFKSGLWAKKAKKHVYNTPKYNTDETAQLIQNLGVRSQAGVGVKSLCNVCYNLTEGVYSHWDTETRIKLLSAIASALAVIDDPKARTTFSTIVRSTDPVVHRSVCIGIENIRDPKAVPVLTTLSKNPYKTIRLAAVKSLGSIGTPGTIPVLSKLSQEKYMVRIPPVPCDCNSDWSIRDDNYDIRIAAVEGLGNIGTPEVIPALANILGTTVFSLDIDCMTLEAAIKALGNIGTPEVIPVLADYLRSIPRPRQPDWMWEGISQGVMDVRSAFMNIRDPEALPAMIELSRDPSPLVRCAAIQRLGTYDTPEAVTALINAAQIPWTGNWSLDQDLVNSKLAAITTLGKKTPTPEIVSALLELANNPETYNNHYASTDLIEILGNMVTPEVVATLIRLAHTQPKATRILGKINTPEVISTLRALSQNYDRGSNSNVREAAQDSLAMLGVPESE